MRAIGNKELAIIMFTTTSIIVMIHVNVGVCAAVAIGVTVVTDVLCCRKIALGIAHTKFLVNCEAILAVKL